MSRDEIIWTTHVNWNAENETGMITFALPSEESMMIHYGIASIKELRSIRQTQLAHNPRNQFSETSRFTDFNWFPGYIEINDYSEISGRIMFDRERLLSRLTRLLTEPQA